VFLVLMLARTFSFLFQTDGDILALVIAKLSLPPSLSNILIQPWSLITYMFLHVDFFHILFNLLVLFWTGKLFVEYLGNDKLIATYLLGGLTGALIYILSFNIFPVFASVGGSAHLVGASAGVIAVLVAVATLLPDYTVFLIIFGAVRLKYIAIVSILLYAISIPNGNAGGELAHLGGALFGFVMIKQLRNGRDLTKWMTALLQFNFKKKPQMKVVRNTNKTNASVASEELVDRILDKINKSGFDSLTKDEKEILYKASGKKG
jgi:membrane associated rhomboid family serine protease